MFSKKFIGNGLKICSIILGMTVLKDEKIVLVLNVQEKSCQVCSWMGGWIDVKAVLRIAYSNRKENVEK